MLCVRTGKSLTFWGSGAYDGGKLIVSRLLGGLRYHVADRCGCIAGIQETRVAAALTSTLAVEILKRGRVPFYCSAWSNIRSVRNAVKSGFIPAWVELSVRPAELVDEMNRKRREKPCACTT